MKLLSNQQLKEVLSWFGEKNFTFRKGRSNYCAGTPTNPARWTLSARTNRSLVRLNTSFPGSSSLSLPLVSYSLTVPLVNHLLTYFLRSTNLIIQVVK
jgi:hypothetical protein